MKQLYVTFCVECLVEIEEGEKISKDLLSDKINEILEVQGIDGIEETQVSHYCDESFENVVSFA